MQIFFRNPFRLLSGLDIPSAAVHFAVIIGDLNAFTGSIMTDSEINSQNLSPRRIGRINTIGLLTLIQKEVGRFTNVYMQTIIAPMVTTALFYTVFAVVFGGAGRMIGEIPYMIFLAPGLIIMSMIQNSFANTSSSLMISKVQGNIVDLLMPPLSPFEILLGYVIAGIVRGFAVGVACLVVVFFFSRIKRSGV